MQGRNVGNSCPSLIRRVSDGSEDDGLPPSSNLIRPPVREMGEGPHADEDEPYDVTGVPLTNSVTFGLESLDAVNLESVFEIRGLVMKSVPKFMRGAIKTSLQAILRRRERNDIEVETRGWKLLMLIPRLLLTRPPRGGLVPQERLKKRVARFNAGEWVPLLELSLECSMQGNVARIRLRRMAPNELQSRAGRALGLARVGELSHARRVLEGEAVAPGQ